MLLFYALCQTNQTFKNNVFQPSPVVALHQELLKKQTNNEHAILLVAEVGRVNPLFIGLIGFFGGQIARAASKSAYEV